MYRNRLAWVFIAATAMTTAAPGPALAGDYTFTNLIDADGPYDGFEEPALNNAGQITMVAWTDASEPVILRTDGTTAVVIADTHGPFFSLTGCGTMQLINVPAINDGGVVAFRALRGDCWTGAVQGIYVGTGGLATEIAEDDGPEIQGLWTHPSINTTGLVAFHAALGGIREAIMGGSGGVPTIIVDNDGPLGALGDPTLNDAGNVAVTATLNGYDTEAIIRSGPGGSYTVIADSDGPWGSFFSNRPGINNSGQVVFLAIHDDGWPTGIFTGDGNTLTLVADTAGGIYSSLQSPSINDSGTVAFWAVENMYNTGLFTGPNPASDKVIVEGDMLFGSPVVNVSMGVAGLNDNGQIAFGYSLDDGRTGIALATPSAVIRGDCDGDGDVDLDDFAGFPDCLSGPDGGLPAPECACFDFDIDGDLDLADCGALQLAFTGSP